jgi:hypothetical protein
MKTMIDLTDRFPMRFDVARMKEELKRLDTEKWLDHYDKALADGWTAVPLVSRDGSMNSTDSQRLGEIGQYRCTRIVEKLPYFRQILDAFQCPHCRIRIMKLMPGTIIRPHRDIFEEVACFAFGQVRLHIPIITNDRVTFNVGGENLTLAPGRLYYVNFAKVHHVRNDGDEPRTHMVLDLVVNDFLRGVFPPVTPVECLENFGVRHGLPVYWQFLRAKEGMRSLFWRAYAGSRLQKLHHRLRQV